MEREEKREVENRKNDTVQKGKENTMTNARQKHILTINN